MVDKKRLVQAFDFQPSKYFRKASTEQKLVWQSHISRVSRALDRVPGNSPMPRASDLRTIFEEKGANINFSVSDLHAWRRLLLIHGAAVTFDDWGEFQVFASDCISYPTEHISATFLRPEINQFDESYNAQFYHDG